MDKRSDLTPLSEKLGLALQQHGDILALAESCTGGLVSASITDIAGSSAWFDRGFVTYSNAAKQEMLHVSASTLQTYGAVSEETAIEMALGARKHSQANITASITGIAGPSGGSTEKPVGTVCFAWVNQDGIVTSTTEYFAGNRQSIREQAAAFSLNALLTQIE